MSISLKWVLQAKQADSKYATADQLSPQATWKKFIIHEIGRLLNLSADSFEIIWAELKEIYPNNDQKAWMGFHNWYGGNTEHGSFYTETTLNRLCFGIERENYLWQSLPEALVGGFVNGKINQDSWPPTMKNHASALEEHICKSLREKTDFFKSLSNEEIRSEWLNRAEDYAIEGAEDWRELPEVPWENDLIRLEKAKQIALSEGRFIEGVNLDAEALEGCVYVFGLIQWLEFWADQGHGYLAVH